MERQSRAADPRGLDDAWAGARKGRETGQGMRHPGGARSGTGKRARGRRDWGRGRLSQRHRHGVR